MEKKNSLLLFNTFNADNTEMDGLADCKCDYTFAVCMYPNKCQISFCHFNNAKLTLQV